MPNIAITGGAGFLGSHLTDRLLDEGHDVFVIDNFQTGQRANLDKAAETGRLRVVKHDVVAPLPDGLPGFAEIFNLACPASPPYYQADPVHTLMISAYGVKNMLDRAKADNARLFHTSTSEVYGDPEVHPQAESYNGNVNPVGPRSCYDVGKRFAESLLTDYSRQHSVEVRFVRIFNTYGPRMQADDGRVVSNFIVQALRNEPITIYGDGSQTRSFCYVDDLIDGFMLLARSGPECRGPMNIGNPTERTVRELADLIIGLTGSRSEIIHLPLPIDDPRKRRPDIARATSLLGWSPKVGIKEGLTKTISYFESQLTEAELVPA